MAKYKLPSSHDLFQTQTLPDLLQEQLEDLYEEKFDIERQLNPKDGDPIPGGGVVATLHKRLGDLNRALGQKELAQDDLIDFWDAELKAGRLPDLDMTLDDLAEIRRGQK